MAGERVHADDTVVPVLEPGLGRTRTARLWVYVRDDRPFAGPDPAAVFYRYTPDRKGEHPRAHLSEFRGILQADGYAGFAKLYDNGQHRRGRVPRPRSTQVLGRARGDQIATRTRGAGPHRARCIGSRTPSAASHPISASPFAPRIRRR